MSETCDLCDSARLDLVYEPESPRGLKVYACTGCGLVQSLPRRDRAPRRSASVSSGADWGNVRYGKGFRTQVHMAVLARHRAPDQLRAVLDVGANRGSFTHALRAVAPAARITAVEPDTRFVGSYDGLDGVTLIASRIEDADLPKEAFDLVYSSHTLEHVGAALETLRGHARALKPDGLLLLEVPNLALVGDADIVEEWFIDKHLFHFTAGTLTAMLEQAGLEIVDGPDPADRVNLTLVAKRTTKAAPKFDSANAVEAAALLSAYAQTRRRNLGRLVAAARSIEAHGADKVAIWGAGRLFHSLVVQGRLDASGLAAVVDRHLPPEAMTVAGRAIARPDALAAVRPEVIVVMSRSFAGEIAAEASAVAPAARLVPFADLLDGKGFATAC